MQFLIEDALLERVRLEDLFARKADDERAAQEEPTRRSLERAQSIFGGKS